MSASAWSIEPGFLICPGTSLVQHPPDRHPADRSFPDGSRCRSRSMSRLVKMTVCSARGTAEDDVAAIPSAARRKAMRPLLFHVVAVNGRLHSRLIKDLGRHQAATAGPDILRELTSTDDGDEFVGRPWSVLTRVTTRRNSVIWMRFSPITATTSSCSTCHRRKTAYAGPSPTATWPSMLHLAAAGCIIRDRLGDRSSKTSALPKGSLTTASRLTGI
jgi:hypothetical protein